MAASKIIKQYIVDTVQTETLSVAANGYLEFTLSAVKSGYKPIGIVGFQKWGSTNLYCYMSHYYISGTNINFILRNTSSTAASPIVRFHVLYEKA